MALLQSLARPLRTAPWRLSLMHTDSAHRMIWITQGQARVLHDAQRRGIGPHQLIAIPAGTGFAMEAGPQITGFLLRLPMQDDLPWSDRALILRGTDLQDQAQMQAALEAIQREQDSDAPYAQEALAAHLLVLSVWLRRHADATPHQKRSAGARLILRFFDHLHRDHAKGGSMGDYAATLGVTPTHLSRVCKSALGKSAADLVNERLLHAARDLLETTKLPAKDISERLGFGSAAYFSRFVKMHTGQTPKALRGHVN